MKNILIGLIMLTATHSANQLKNEQSPYLQQHADNPVHWMPWNKTTLQKAKDEGKMIFLSIGYSTCHWCHVMEEESFERDDAAKAINDHYIAIKVDREEMPQLDSYYQRVYQLMNGRGGGWPLTMILTPDARPFWSATYLPKDNLISVLTQIDEIYQNEPKKITENADEIAQLIARADKQKSKNADSDLEQTIQTFSGSVSASFDEMSGGFGTAPKFPRATLLESMLDLYATNGDKQILSMVESTLQGMMKSGIYDQIEGGFYRYSVDRQWHIPHFEKMLYTQAELLRVYAKAYRITLNKDYKKIVDELISFVNKRFDKDYLLYSASDADSLTPKGDKEEGYYFVFEYQSTLRFLTQKGLSGSISEAILAHFGITPDGNFEHSSTNPYTQGNKSIPDTEKAKQLLSELRSHKKYPFVDHKIQTSWNAMYISALVQAAKVDNKYAKEATSRMDELLKNMIKDGTLYHQKLHGKPLKIVGLFEDYAFLIEALLDLYELEYKQEYIKLASKLAKEAIAKFGDNGHWNLSDDSYKTHASLYDSAYASPASVMTRALLKLALQTDDLDIYKIAQKSITQDPDMMRRYPDSIATAFGTFVGYKTRYKVLKSTKKALLQHKRKIEALANPYLLTRATELDKELYLGCEINACFATDRNLDVVLEKIKNRQ